MEEEEAVALTGIVPTHSHPTRTPWYVYLLMAVLVGVIAAQFITFSYLNGRRAVIDHRNEQQRQVFCAVFDEIPVGRDAAIDRSRVVLRCGSPHPHRRGAPSPSPGAGSMTPPPPEGTATR
jgi:hypothetical protein